MTGRGEDRFGRHAHGPLHRERRVEQQAARVPSARVGGGLGPGEPQLHVPRARQPGPELHRGPVVPGAAEGDDHGTVGGALLAHQQGHVARDLAQDRRELRFGDALHQERGRRLQNGERDVPIRREPDDVRPGTGRGERCRADVDAPRGQGGTHLLHARGLGREVGLGRNEARHDELVALLPHQPLAQIREAGER